MKTDRKCGKTVRMAAITAAAIFLIGSLGVCAQGTEGYKDSANNYYFSGENGVVDGGMLFGAFGAGKNLTLRNVEAEDSVALAGLNLETLGCDIDGSAYMAGFDIKITGCSVDGNIMAAGNSVLIGEDTSANAVNAVGSDVTFSGNAKALMASAGTVVINGEVDGDAVVEAQNVVIGDTAKVTGALKIEAENEPQIPDGAQIGTYEFTQVVKDSDKEEQQAVPGALQAVAGKDKDMGTVILGKVKSALYWSVAMGIVGLLLYWLAKKHLVQSGEMMTEHPAAMLGTGAAVLLLAPLAGILCMVTIIGAPAGLLTIGIYAFLIFLAPAFAGAALGMRILKKLPPLGAALLGIVVLEILKKIPYLGIAVSIGAVLFAMGYFVRNLYGSRTKRTPKNADFIETETRPAENCQ